MRQGSLAVAVVAMTLAGCATVTKETFIHERAGAYVYDKPLEEVWPHAKALLKEKGFSFRQREGQPMLETAWKEAMGSSTLASSTTRYAVQGFPLSANKSQVRILRQTASTAIDRSSLDLSNSQAAALAQARGATNNRRVNNSNVTRDLELEWELMQRAAPEDAKELEAAADAAVSKK